ncbi:YuzB family protein [Bacillaceae bacterium SIJ1]|uniref:YuzB family protein n=1 Tax=Litoribacterium kuwaitense TaxID=1398745 RepID=UPI0013EBEE11|nr:YuzB family protein [Litoribacterium kuwaitense]NGP46630.1 YuzB family protein [Litoribacterium kuwaitense]
MNPMIEFCVTNLANGSQEALEKLENDPNLDVLEYGCLSYCTVCATSLYALVNGDVVTADEPNELVERIYQHIEENPMF